MRGRKRIGSDQGSGRLSPEMRRFELWTVCLFLISICFHGVMYGVLHRRNWLAFPMDLHRSWLFADFLVFTEKYRTFHSYHFFSTGLPMVYPAPVAALFGFFFKLPPPHSLWAMLAFCLLALIVPAALFGRALCDRGIPLASAFHFTAVLLLLSWPAALIVNGANSEVFVWGALVVSVWAYVTGRLWMAALGFGIAVSLKLFPVVFFALFLRRGQLTKLGAAIAVSAASFLLALWYIGPTVGYAFHGFLDGMRFAKVAYFSSWRDLEHGVDHSLFGLIKFFGTVLFPHREGDFHGLLKPYQVLTAAGGLALYGLRIRKLPLINQVLTLSIISIYFTAFSGDGTLIHLYYALALLFLFSMEADREGWVVPGLDRLIGSMAFCLSYESFLVLPVTELGLRFEGPAHAVGLGLMLFWGLRYPMAPPPSTVETQELYGHTRAARI